MSKEAMKQAIETLKAMQNAIYNIGGEHVLDLNCAIEKADVAQDAIKALEAALTQEQGEPVAWVIWFCGYPAGFFEKETDAIEAFEQRNLDYPEESRKLLPLYTTPQQRTWVGLTIDEREQIQQECFGKVPHHVAFAHAIEAKLKEKNT